MFLACIQSISKPRSECQEYLANEHPRKCIVRLIACKESRGSNAPIKIKLRKNKE